MDTLLTLEIDMNDSWSAVILMFILAVAAIIFGPIIIIWALNTLFPALAIPYTIETWFAVIALKGFVVINVKKTA